ncbi:MAG: nucleotidyltransferase domain-containing protein [Candidatus Berkelbacteria bacterium]|nr:nucleotidyltransferase domain-containing protein [Candidatus Berkelbacteria bacterium]
MTEKTISELKAKTTPIFKKYGVIRAGVFGSYARGETTKNSDIDFYVIYPKGITLFDISGLAYDLEKNVGKKIDLADGSALREEFKPYIMKDLKMFYEKTK